jgi:hypothetical protein
MEEKAGLYHLVPEVCGTGTNLMGYSDDELKRISFSYLHGKVEDKAGYDIFSFFKKVPEAEGIYKGFVEFPNEIVFCTIFLWKANDTKGLQGLVVADNDIECFDDAKKKYENKDYFI